ncbi:MAG: SlyX family protein [Polyangiaceae bacterium]
MTDASVSELSKRLVELEVRYTHQQDTIEQLSDALYAQQREIDALKAKLGNIDKRMAESGGVEPVTDPSIERPPHY